jgi:hypothetical protein
MDHQILNLKKSLINKVLKKYNKLISLNKLLINKDQVEECDLIRDNDQVHQILTHIPIEILSENLADKIDENSNNL